MPAEERAMSTNDDPIARAGALLEELRARAPRVHAITNAAAQGFTANLLLAAGAVPSLTTSPEEAPAFTARADALVVNLGTLDAERRAAIPWCIAACRGAGKPWVLDPVFVEASPSRLDLARLALTGRPTAIRCNALEAEALMGEAPTPAALAVFALAHETVVALTGATDVVADGKRLVRIGNGHPLMGRVTAMGCAGTTLIAAFAALEPDPWLAATCGLLVLGVAGEIAGEAARGPGSFPAAFLDALDALTGADIAARARLS
jgi:hydroxyethylthiazole kinase